MTLWEQVLLTSLHGCANSLEDSSDAQRAVDLAVYMADRAEAAMRAKLERESFITRLTGRPEMAPTDDYHGSDSHA